MKFEIERKFLVKDNWPKPEEGNYIQQGYISDDQECVVRVRVQDTDAWLTVKSLKTQLTRLEYEYKIPYNDAIDMLEHVCMKPLIEKNRFSICSFGMEWEIDEFLGENNGLIVAEVELENEDQEIEIPDWIGKEVSHDPKYFNANLISNPYKNWNK